MRYQDEIERIKKVMQQSFDPITGVPKGCPANTFDWTNSVLDSNANIYTQAGLSREVAERAIYIQQTDPRVRTQEDWDFLAASALAVQHQLVIQGNKAMAKDLGYYTTGLDILEEKFGRWLKKLSRNTLIELLSVVSRSLAMLHQLDPVEEYSLLNAVDELGYELSPEVVEVLSKIDSNLNEDNALGFCTFLSEELRFGYHKLGVRVR